MNSSRSSEMVSGFICAPETMFVDLTFLVVFPNCMLTLVAYLLFVMIMVSYKLKSLNITIITQMHLRVIGCFIAASAPLLLSLNLFMISNFTKSCYRLSNIQQESFVCYNLTRKFCYHKNEQYTSTEFTKFANHIVFVHDETTKTNRIRELVEFTQHECTKSFK